jgi:hypothetical protein
MKRILLVGHNVYTGVNEFWQESGNLVESGHLKERGDGRVLNYIFVKEEWEM